MSYHNILTSIACNYVLFSAVPALPQIDMLPGTRSFRPYTTYELELIRRHQKMYIYIYNILV